MRRASTWASRLWYGEGGTVAGGFRLALLPAESLFRAGVALRGMAYDRGWLREQAVSVPVVSVGNLSVGGTGKTPFASWVVGRAQALGRTPALLARGYGQDEILLHRRWTPGVHVVAEPDRIRGVDRAVAAGADTVILDDAFQHRRLARDVDVVLISAEQGLPGPLLPRGPFREPLAALVRADAVVVTRKSAAPRAAARTLERARTYVESLAGSAPPGPGPGPRVWGRVALLPGAYRRLHARGAASDACARPEGPVGVLTSVAQPRTVVASVEATGLAVADLVAYPDHHDFTTGEVQAALRRLGGGPVVVTEKDAVKIRRLDGLVGAPLWTLGQRMEWERGLDEVNTLLEELWRPQRQS